MKLDRKYIIRLTVKLMIIAQYILVSGCKKMLEVDLPVDKITKETAYSSESTTVQVLNGIYSNMSGDYFVLPNDIFLPMAADELTSSLSLPIYLNAIPIDDSSYGLCWKTSYNLIYSCNSVIEGVSASPTMVEKDKAMLIAEAKFTRGVLYFNLLNTYGGIPLAVTSDFKINSKLDRSTEEQVYQQIEKDLLDAKANLGDNYLASDLASVTADRIRPTKWAATALLARMYLYQRQWQKAESAATEIIQNTSQFETVALEQVFKKNSKETIWALQPKYAQGAGVTSNTREAENYVPFPGTRPVIGGSISNNLISAFQPGDKRKDVWLGLYVDNSVTPSKNYYFPYKYQIGANYTQAPQSQDEYSIVLRLGEQYLIRAEARAHQQNLTGAKEDLDVIRKRAGLGGITITTAENMYADILKERQVELFMEFGHRWFDLKRTGKIDEVMSVQTKIKGGTWESYKALFPIPYSEIILNPSLQGHQNPGWPERQ